MEVYVREILFFLFQGCEKKINEKNVGNLATDVRSVRQRESVISCVRRHYLL